MLPYQVSMLALPSIIMIAFIVLVCIMIKRVRRASLVERAVFSNSTVKVNVTKMVRRHLLSNSMLSIVDVVPQDLLDCDDFPYLEVFFKQPCGGSIRRTFEEARDVVDVIRNI